MYLTNIPSISLKSPSPPFNCSLFSLTDTKLQCLRETIMCSGHNYKQNKLKIRRWMHGSWMVFVWIFGFSTDPEVPCLPERATKLLGSNAGIFSPIKYPEKFLIILEEMFSAVELAGAAEQCLSSFPSDTAGMATFGFGAPESGSSVRVSGANRFDSRGSKAVIFVTAIAWGGSSHTLVAGSNGAFTIPGRLQGNPFNSLQSFVGGKYIRSVVLRNLDEQGLSRLPKGDAQEFWGESEPVQSSW